VTEEKVVAQAGTAATHSESLWRNQNFAAFWVGQTVSTVGTQVTFVALPMIAVLNLHATAGEVGVLRFAEYLPFLLCTLPFGVWADRRRRRPLMLFSYAACGLIVASVPLCAAFGLLSLPLLVTGPRQGCGLSGSRASPEHLADYIRGHWSIEALHHIRDVTYAEDPSQVRTGNALRVMARECVVSPSAWCDIAAGPTPPRRALPRPQPWRPLTALGVT
jgi:hypothetical protein